MNILPDSTVNLYSGIEIDDGEQIAFASSQEQATYFASHLTASAVNCTIVRKTGTLRLELGGVVVSGCDYISFINPSFDNKTIYARITDYEFVNGGCTEISYAIDAFQTWCFDVTYHASYIEREHLSKHDFDDIERNPIHAYSSDIFEFTTDESLPIGKTIEKPWYTIGSDYNSDGYRLTRAITSAGNTSGVLCKFNAIDLEGLDNGYTGAVAGRPSLLMHNYLLGIQSQDMGFYHITEDMRVYLNAQHAAYPSNYTATFSSTYFVNPTGWKDNDSTLIYPQKSSTYNPGCCMAYDQYGADESNNNGMMSAFLNMMTKYENVDGIIDMSIIPNNIMILAGSSFDGTSNWQCRFRVPDGSNITNKKLLTFPYTYLRVLSPNGDAKEYKYEMFKDIEQGEENAAAVFNLILDISDRPVLIIAPKGYKYTGIGNLYGVDANILETIYFEQWPTMPYTINAFDAQVAATANATIANRTVDNAADMASTDVLTNKHMDKADTLNRIVSGVSSVLGRPDSAELSGADIAIQSAGLLTSTATNAYASGATRTMNRRKFEQARDRWMGANASKGADGGVIASQLRLCKSAYACDKYYASNGIGVTNFLKMSFYDAVLLQVQLNPTILEQYDQYFTLYGYQSGRCGIARIINYITSNGGNIADTDAPAWIDYGNDKITYVKTMDLHVTHSMQPVADAIKNLFDSGCRFKKGTVTPQ